VLRTDVEGAGGGPYLNQAPGMGAAGLDSQTRESTSLNPAFPGNSNVNPNQIDKQPAEVI
jgi:hypothetical protein